VIITLTGTDGMGGAVTLTTTTASGGAFWFTGLKPGSYSVTETVPDGRMPTTPTTSGPHVLDSGDNLDLMYVFGNTTTVSIHGVKFYDKAVEGNVLGQHDLGEPGVGGIEIVLTGNKAMGDPVNLSTFTATQAEVDVDPDDDITQAGQFWFADDLMPGTYTITEVLPDGWLATTDISSGPHTLMSGDRLELGYVFGNLQRKDTGAHTIGYWQNKHGRGIIEDMMLLDELSALNLRDQAGDHFDPATVDEWRTWLKGANGENMAYMLSAQMAAMYLNIQADFVDAADFVLVEKQDGTLTFLDISDVIDAANEVLGLNPDGVGGLLLVSGATDGEADASGFVTTLAMFDGTLRDYAGFLKNILDDGNNDENFIHACPPGADAINVLDDPSSGNDSGRRITAFSISSFSTPRQFQLASIGADASISTDSVAAVGTDTGSVLDSSLRELQTSAASTVSLPLTTASTQVFASPAPILPTVSIDRGSFFDTVNGPSLPSDITQPSFQFFDRFESYAQLGDSLWHGTRAATGRDVLPKSAVQAGSLRSTSTREAELALLKVTESSEFELALTELTDELADRPQHRRRDTNRHSRRLDRDWNETHFATVQRESPVDAFWRMFGR
jgi:hypothetical protein